jgi:chromosome segregation protein
MSALKEKIEPLSSTKEEEEHHMQDLKREKERLSQELTKEIQQNDHLKNKITSLQESIENNASLPYGVKAVLNHPKLEGIHGAIANLIEMDEEYVTAITTSLGAASNFVVVETENHAKNAIMYLKENKLGRVTFFPMNIIKAKTVEEKIKESLNSMTGFIDIASSLVKYDPKYKNIIENQLGNVLVVDTIDHANIISKRLDYRYKIVTLDGELLHIGGSLTGGSTKEQRSILKEKYELEENLKKLDYSDLKIKEYENKINEVDYAIASSEDKIYLFSKKCIEVSESYTLKDQTCHEKENHLKEIENEIEGNDGILKKSLSSEEEKVMQEYYDALGNKKKTEISLESLQAKKKQMGQDLEEFEFETRKENSLVASKNKELKNLEIEVNRMDVKLDTLLVKLSENYSMTYEHAKENYHLDLEEDLARERVSTLKLEIKDLGVINVLAIEEYEKVSERYNFLKEQKEDLLHAEDTLLEIIREMDEVMEKEFTETFKMIRENFKSTFKDLFHGGDADLRLTDPKNMLETGIEIVASPPGKTLKSISFLSGGEKTFTAISLLFAILKSRPVPYCILDEVEAALDEVNVDSFGEYLLTLKEKTQFILITHKKKTMEYADYLYGITMQESGVSKLVSVKLEEVKL